VDGWDFGGRDLGGGGIFCGEVAPVVIPQELGQGIQGMGVGEAVVFDLAPNTLQGYMADRDPCLVPDEFAKLQKVLVGPVFAVTPAGFFLEHLFYLPDQAVIGMHNS
jgi:hypothetical protein